jgi:hypothetical protein
MNIRSGSGAPTRAPHDPARRVDFQFWPAPATPRHSSSCDTDVRAWRCSLSYDVEADCSSIKWHITNVGAGDAEIRGLDAFKG